MKVPVSVTTVDAALVAVKLTARASRKLKAAKAPARAVPSRCQIELGEVPISFCIPPARALVP